MHFFKLMIIFCCFHVFSLFAATVSCSPQTSTTNNYNKWSEIHVPYELKPSKLTMTLGTNVTDWTVIYTAAHINVGMSASNCTASLNMYYTILNDATLVGTIGEDYIYSTNISGIGISISADVNSASLQNYPSSIYSGGAGLGVGFWATIKYWKIPGMLPMSNGPMTVTGTDVAVIYMYPGYKINSGYSDRVIDNGNAYISSSRILTLTMLFLPGTCNIEGDNVNVNMGDYDGAGGHSEWRDASFKLVCPNGMGYNGASDSDNSSSYNNPYSIASDTKISANDKANGKVEISIVPLNNGAIDPNRGIIALDGTGAQGYGIQLAWGDYSTQNATEPVHPVILNSYVDAHSLNSAFSGDLTPLGGNGFTGGDNTIKMAARYIRTSGDAAPGPANAVVQVIANYQ